MGLRVHQNKPLQWSSTDSHPSDKKRPMDGAQHHSTRVGEAGSRKAAEESR